MLREICSVFGLLRFRLLVWDEWQWKVFWKRQLPELFLTLRARSEFGCSVTDRPPPPSPAPPALSNSLLPFSIWEQNFSPDRTAGSSLTSGCNDSCPCDVPRTFYSEVCVNLGIFLNCWAVSAKSNTKILIFPSKSLLAENPLHLEK